MLQPSPIPDTKMTQFYPCFQFRIKDKCTYSCHIIKNNCHKEEKLMYLSDFRRCGWSTSSRRRHQHQHQHWHGSDGGMGEGFEGGERRRRDLLSASWVRRAKMEIDWVWGTGSISCGVDWVWELELEEKVMGSEGIEFREREDEEEDRGLGFLMVEDLRGERSLMRRKKKEGNGKEGRGLRREK